MRKTGIIVISFLFVILSYFTFISAKNAFQSGGELPETSGQKKAEYRLVLITKELETPFWDKVSAGALEQAKKSGASLEIWGSYGNNNEDFLKKIEIAIHSKVDGIIVQGLDNEEFKQLTKIKSAFYGIPIVTVANDVPMEESLRKTYVGSDQIWAGKLMAIQLLSDMGSSGNVVIMRDTNQEYYQQQRLNGILEILKDYPNVQTIIAETPFTEEQVISTTRDSLNKMPNADAFIAVNAYMAGAMVQEIGKRSEVDPYYIYTFDDGPESLSLLEQGKLDGIIEQSPEKMGRLSVYHIMTWLSDQNITLDRNGYLTDVRMLKAVKK